MTYWSIITAAAKTAHVSVMLLWAICAHESRDFSLDYSLYDKGSPSFGICQIKKNTAFLMGWRGKDEMELRNAEVSTKYAALYLAYQLDRYDGNWVKAVAAYNSGSYNESEKYPGYPKNLKYVRLVQKKLPQELKNKLEGKN